MPDPTARDAVTRVIWKSREPGVAVLWRTEDGKVYVRRQKASEEDTADAVLSALGIPPEMTASDVARAISTHVQTRAWQERVIAEQRDLTADQEDAT